jgi:hypothetical protein
VRSRKFSPKEEDLTCIVDPQQQHDEPSGRPIRRRNSAAANVPANERFPRNEENRRDNSAEGNIPPFKVAVWQDFEDGRKEE